MKITPTNYPMKVHSLSEFDATKLPEYVVEGLLLSGEVSMLVGPSNTGKTAFAVQLARHIVTGTPVLGRDVRAGMVLYIAAEGPRSVLTRAHAAFRDDEGREHFVTLEMQPNLLDRPCVDEIIAFARELMEAHGVGFALVVVDTFILSSGGRDENNNVEMSLAILGARQIAEALAAHVLLIHHTGKDSDRGARGASSLRANIDTELLCDTTGKNAGRVQQSKQRNLEKGYGLGYRLAPVEIAKDPKGRPVTAVVATFEMIDESAFVANEAKKPRPVDPLEAAIETVLLAQGPQSVEIILKLLPTRLFSNGTKAESRAKAVERALKNMQAAEVVRVTKVGRNNSWTLASRSPVQAA